MRSVTFKSVLDGVLRRLGLDPAAEHLAHDTARAVTEHINTRLETAWTCWPWKELEVTSERAFRPFWDEAVAYKEGDEFYLQDGETGTYYRTLTDSVAGVDPAVNDDAFEVIDAPLYRMIPFLQTGQEAIGQVFGVYPTDPHANSATAPLSLGFRQTEDGLEINSGVSGAGDTLWITYRLAPPIFTTVPVVTGKTYAAGDVAYFPAEENCKIVVTPASGETPAVWKLLAFPAMFAPYVKLGATSDALLEASDENVTAEKVQMRLAKANRLETTAERMLGELTGRQVEQGQRAKYRRWGQPRSSRWLYAA